MAKKKSRAKYTSKHERNNVSKQNRTPATTAAERHENKLRAFLEGRKVYFTIDNPNTKETNKRKIRVEGRELFGDYRKFNSYHVIR